MADNGHAVAHHPSPKQYVMIAIALAIITAIEVALFYVNEAVDMQGWDAPMLIILSFLKFVVVIGWYMHLRFESGLLRNFFTAGFILAMVLYAIVLASFAVGVITAG